MRAKIRLTGLWFLPVVSLFTLISCGSKDTPPVLSRFEATACKQTLAPGSTTQCGYLIVPEDRSKPEGKQIKLYVGIFKNPNGASGTEPLVYLTGGPGSETASAYAIFEDTTGYVRRNFGDNRDIIVLDQRGTNNSSPALYCSQELAPLRNQVYGISYHDAAVKRTQAFAACYSRLQAQGIDLSAYDTVENATDVRDLAILLGYKKVNIYSASYGTRLAMLTMKHYPEVIRSVVLDSILPPEINPFEQEALAVLYSFRSFFDAAKAKYPDLETQFYAMLGKLETTPVNVTGHHYDSSGNPVDNIVVNVTGDKLVDYLVAQLKSTPYNPALPKTLSAMYTNGNYGAAADSWLGSIDFMFPNGGPGSGSPSVGMFNSVFGAEDAYYTSPQRIEQVINQNVSNKSIASWLHATFIDREPEILGLWPVEPLSFRENDPVVSDIPTLMLVGTLDNATPAIFSMPSAAYLSRSFYFPILAGHATAYLECVDQMLNNFVKNPLAAPANTCMPEYQWQ